ncbi:hypothetical protein [Clostridium faecium]|uniref:Uncharacterized protein n=1 Tax=Clostridium faecium TaxID=2762223 RepID=A0ABR8YNK7_9CLOT|nr:hypothetical protein [Clostridium faecium]MBD8045841.1 hypothetical protein [Clostridium faecium]
MAKKILFLGANNTGKTHIMLVVGKILTELKNEVLLIDNSSSKGVYNYFNYNTDVESEIAATSQEIVRENICIRSNIGKIQEEQYDYILIESDNVNQNLNAFSKVFIVQNYDKDKLIKNKEIIKHYNNSSDFCNVHFVFNQMLQNVSDREYLFQELIEVMKNKTQILKNEDIEIPFLEEDLIVSSLNKFNGGIKLKKYSGDFKQSIFQLINFIMDTEIDNKKFKKIIEERRF